MLAPMAPHLAEELWQMLGHAEALDAAHWPNFVPQLAEEEQVEIVFQINGRVRGKLLVDSGLGENELMELAMADERIGGLLRGAQMVKRVVVPNKLVNIVLR
jgi:leucyl-tRNA synthetase